MCPLYELPRDEGNAILCMLPMESRVRLLRGARRLYLEPGQVLCSAGEVFCSLYFPTSCIVSHSFTTQDGVSISMGLTGNDGLVGLPVLLGARAASHSALVQIGGVAVKISASVAKAEFAQCLLLQQAILQYTHVFMTQLAQTAACNRLHSLEQRLCRWLLLCHDRASSDEMVMTHEAMAGMVGGRRESITVAAGRLQDLRVIRHTRGRIRILDRDALKALACECLANEPGEKPGQRVWDRGCTRTLGSAVPPAPPFPAIRVAV